MTALLVHGESLANRARRFSGRVARHLEGWQLGVVSVGIALGAAVIALPRPVPPRELPLPVVDRVERRDARAADAARARGAAERPLPFQVRAAGEAFRRFGKAEVDGDALMAESLRAAFENRIEEARRRSGNEPILSLRAVQTDLFVGALLHGARTGQQAQDVAELGGAFRKLATDSGWLAGDRVELDPDALAILFVVRWTKLAGLLDTFPFSPTLNDWRLYYRTLLEHPEVRAGQNEKRRPRPELLADYVRALSRKDPDYPDLLARGILEHWVGNYASADQLIEAHLRQHPTGSWRLRAQNFLLAARRQVPAPRSITDPGTG